MSVAKLRKRSSNWLSSEKELLLSLVKLHYNVVENKQTDGLTMRRKLAEWQIIANQYNSRTTHCSRTGENLKAQWESLKKVARKDAANRRQQNIQTGDGSPLSPTKDDSLLQRVLSLISTSDTSAIGKVNRNDSVSIVPAVQDQAAISNVQMNIFPESPPIPDKVADIPTVIGEDQKRDMVVICDTKELFEKDWGDYTPRLGTPVSMAPKSDESEKETTNKKRTGLSRGRPTHTSTSLEQLLRKKIEAIELQKKLAVEEMERSKVAHGLDLQIKKEILKQEKIKTHLLLIRRRNLRKKK